MRLALPLSWRLGQVVGGGRPSELTISRRVLPLIALLIVACNSQKDALLVERDTVAGQAETFLAAWSVDPDGASESFDELEGDIEQISLLRALATNQDFSLDPLCGRLSNPGVSQECARLAMRPHLRHGRTTRGREFGNLILDAGLHDGLRDLPPSLDVACLELGGEQQSTCQHLTAARSALEGDLKLAAAACNAIHSEVWRDECFFGLAEAVAVGPLTPERAAGAAHLCMSAGSTSVQCFTHLSGRLARISPLSPTSEEQSGTAWRKVSMLLDAAVSAAAETHVPFSARLE